MLGLFGGELSLTFALIQYHHAIVQAGNVAFSGVIVLLLLYGNELGFNGFLLLYQGLVFLTILHVS